MKNLIPLFVFAIVTFVAISGCQPPVTEAAIDMDAVKTEIAAMENAFAAGLAAKDADAVVAYYADDAQSLASNQPTQVGKQAIRARIQENIKNAKEGEVTTFTVTDVWASGDLAVETGTSKTVNATGEVTETGKYMSLFEKRDGKYICIRDIWNSDSDDDDEDEDDGDENTEE